MKTRRIRELDGLRGIAVLMVLFNHFNEHWLSGGFVGVDIFFVLSGYVVSNSVFNRVSLIKSKAIFDFYKRRFIRILPALIVCILTVTLLSVLLIPRSWLSQSLEATGIWSILGFSNVAQILTNDGYFAPTSNFNPFTHTWSLGVEEQFYILIPILLISLRKKLLFAVVSFLSIFSLFLAIYYSTANQVFAFYSLLTRFWELGIGVLLAVLSDSRVVQSFIASLQDFSRYTRLKQLFTMLGLLLIAISAIYLNSSILTPWPGSLLPVLGTTLIILSTFFNNKPFEDQRFSLSLLLANPLFLWFGFISYALYLWHWPVIVLMKWTIGLDDYRRILFGVLISILLAYLSTYWIERPFSLFLKNTKLNVILVGLSSSIMATFVVKSLFDNRNLITLSTVNKNQNEWYAEAQLNNGTSNKKITIHVLGNSHALAYAPMLEAVHRMNGWNTRIYPLGSCSIGYVMYVAKKTSECTRKVDSVMSSIKLDSKKGDILWFASLRIPKYIDQWGILPNNPIELVDSDKFMIGLKQGFDEMVSLVKVYEDKGYRVMIDRPKPVFKSPPFRCSDYFNKYNSICKSGFAVDRNEFMLVGGKINSSINKLQALFPSLIVWDPSLVLCPESSCSAFDGIKPLYFDGDHLSKHGNLLLVDDFSRVIHEALTKKSNHSDHPLP